MKVLALVDDAAVFDRLRLVGVDCRLIEDVSAEDFSGVGLLVVAGGLADAAGWLRERVPLVVVLG
ncbi:MAG: hypothetical protein FWC78_01035 [Defluviitaleaceae bacterium]|nr:hypothetical protein [Defluviitaleaceae bacterium]